ncbi:hypothetical protein SAMN05720469_11637 [Fibrobacter intestinalis]|uniref:Uncharacterized protein n=1 Tax=Fibrobacter intestinalis TaxID=28122 RepID=A0A1M6V1R5_9BACT|nr:hypothetical protein SAMN05720469_11637 [Fibrobacter intestinalis]
MVLKFCSKNYLEKNPKKIETIALTICVKLMLKYHLLVKAIRFKKESIY